MDTYKIHSLAARIACALVLKVGGVYLVSIAIFGSFWLLRVAFLMLLAVVAAKSKSNGSDELSKCLDTFLGKELFGEVSELIECRLLALL